MDWLNRRIRRAVLAKLQRMRRGRLTIIDPAGVTRVGDGAESDPAATIRVHSLDVYQRLAWEGANGAGEAYLDGQWETDQLAAVTEVFARNASLVSGLGSRWVGGWMDWGRRLLRRNTVEGSRRNIAAHYDLSNDFFALFLDPTMAYSAGVFDERSGGTLEGASRSKFERVCAGLELGPNDHLLEIGGGWGGLAMYAAQTHGCRVTTTTISKEQYRYMRKAVADAKLDHQVTVLCDDYRKLRGSYDKIVSIEMIEAVGHEYFATFFRQCQQLLKADGLMMLQAILIPDQRYARYRKSQDFIQRHIFPGGCLPSLGALCSAAAEETEMKLIQVEDWADHYARTLQLWRRKFRDRLDDVRALGMDDRFIRAWDYYLSYCEGGFRERQLQLTHLLFAGAEWRGNLALAAPSASSAPTVAKTAAEAEGETLAPRDTSLDPAEIEGFKGAWA